MSGAVFGLHLSVLPCFRRKTLGFICAGTLWMLQADGGERRLLEIVSWVEDGATFDSMV